MKEVYGALGWQGGTVHQIVAEIERLKKVEMAAIEFGNEVAFAASIGQIRKCNTGIARRAIVLSALLFHGGKQ